MSGAGFAQHSSAYEIKTRVVITKQAPRKYYAFKLKIHQTLQYPFSWLCVLLKLTPKFNTNSTKHVQYKSNLPLRTPTTWKFFFFWHSSKKNDTECQQLSDVVSKLSIRNSFLKSHAIVGSLFLITSDCWKGHAHMFKGRLHITKSLTRTK